MELGMSAEQITKIANSLLESKQEKINEIIGPVTTDSESKKLVEAIFAVSTIIVPEMILKIIEANNKVISTQLEFLLEKKQ